ncbi:envelope stress response activation lipoprotein NlpE [Entomohabitans teleogrylli]|uniref:envelope stress response activation lipoprotein NlpE n=1 Tax=Entomohabitans teleogrylli TaxID=1384589 RepID=UPI00073D77C9|nr:envelope stress response activation lipoprotein NlpE [Entomohabitans teleogrylli]
MKKIILSVMAAVGLFTLIGCNNHSESQIVAPAELAEFKPMQQSFRGVLPCADCGGVDTSLFLAKDGTWVMKERYQGKAADAVFSSWGTWARTANKLVLTQSNGEKRYFHPEGEGLEMLDRDGNPIQSALNYRLQPTKDALPTTPMAMKGMYKYMADAAIFTDCATGRTFGVDGNPQLERDYIAARGTEMRPVLLIVQAHFTLRANPDSGEMRKTIVADSRGQFQPGKDCD